MRTGERFDELTRALRAVVPALEEAEVPYVLGGSMACWAYGGAEPFKDLDVMVRPEHASRAIEALADAGLEPDSPPEDWLLKAWYGDVLVDVIFRPRGLELTDEVFARARWRNVLALQVRVMALEDVFTSKLLALDEHQLDLGHLLELARPIREQVRWAEVRRRTEHWPYAAPFFTLIERLGLADAGNEGALAATPAAPVPAAPSRPDADAAPRRSPMPPRPSTRNDPSRVHERPPDPAEEANRPLERKHPDQPEPWPSQEPRQPGGQSGPREPHHRLAHPVGEPDPTADSDPYDPEEGGDEAAAPRQ
jgi:hypothetical protein